LGLAALGTFTAAMRIAQGLQVLVTSTSAASAHAFAQASDEADHHRVRSEYRVAMLFSAVFGVPAVIGLIVYRDQVVGLLVPDGFVGAAGVLAWCALAQLANVVSGPSATLMYLTGRAESLLRIGVVSVVSACAAAWILGESYGVVGAAAGYAIGFWVRAGFQVERITRT
jgi:O-antigen/teichoic acid export membrane protein